MKRVVVDAFGGDNAPVEIISGCAMALAEIPDLYLILTGDEQRIEQELAKHKGIDRGRVEVRHAPDVITNNEHPVNAVRRKKDSSLVKALEAVASKEAEVFVSAGSTGAVLAGATFIVRRIKGVKRPALAPVLPTRKDHDVILIDCGANVECTPEYLLQFAYMGSFYAKKIMGCENPRVALLNVGTEETKGTELQKHTYNLLKKAHEAGRINFVGNAEASDLFLGSIDVMVTDGFSGNILLKGTEGAVKFLLGKIVGILKGSRKAKVAALMIRGDLSDFKVAMDVSEVGGTALLGISQPVIKAHGSSDARAIRSAIKQAIRFIEAGVIREIEENIEFMKLTSEE